MWACDFCPLFWDFGELVLLVELVLVVLID